jgi:hypothetical protein
VVQGGRGPQLEERPARLGLREAVSGKRAFSPIACSGMSPYMPMARDFHTAESIE